MISAIVLAAGKSTRMGRPKANLPIGGGDTFLSRIVRTFNAAGIDDVVVVVGHDADPIAASLGRTGVGARLVTNRGYEAGQLSSFITGIDAVDCVDLNAALITLVDVPLVSAATIRAVVSRWLDTRAPVVRPVRGEEHGHPVLIARSLFDEIRRADPSVGAKTVVRSHASTVGDVIVDDPGAFLDIDTAAPYAALIEPADRRG